MTKYGANLLMSPEFDSQEEFYSVTESLGVEFRFKHVQGHQDNDTPYEDMGWDAQLNVEKDTEVAEFLSSPEPGLEPTPCAPHYLANKISLTIAGVQRLRKAAVNAYNGTKLREYMMEQNGWTEAHFNRVDWHALESALSAESHNFRV